MAGRGTAVQDEQVDLVYSRFNHPNAEILEAQILPLETGAEGALAFNSGMAAIMTALFTFLKPGDSIVYTVPIYGGTQKLIENFLSDWGVKGVAVEAGQTAKIDAAIRETKHLRIVLIETPANPTGIMTDIRRAVEAVSGLETKSLVMVDNTM